MARTHHKPARARFPRRIATFIAFALAAPLPARAVIEPDFERGTGPALTTWYGPSNAAAMRADRDYLAGMRPHHAGALTMSQEYLVDPASSSPLLRQLARAIIINQQFEVLLLDQVARRLDLPPVTLPFGIRLQPMATEGLAQALLFRREPIPGQLGYAMGPVSERDVQFAKAMTIHHQGALDMAHAYHANSDARNGFLGLFNVDVVTDQSTEIALMGRVIRAYAGDPRAVRVDPAMIHGMEGMSAHGGHSMGNSGTTAAEEPMSSMHPAAPRPASAAESHHATPHQPRVETRAPTLTGHEDHSQHAH